MSKVTIKRLGSSWAVLIDGRIKFSGLSREEALKEALERSMTDYQKACLATVRECPDGYARAYAERGYIMTDPEEIRVQCLYILNNMGHWRGPTAKECREIFKKYTQEKRNGSNPKS
jgi:hypothetical protein